MIDCLIEGGRIVDGSGGPSIKGSVGIDKGKIVSVGKTTESARRRVDADGLCVAPGLVDPHTHFDAQLMWDPTASPAIFHGITTVVAGNCGFAIAPVLERDIEYLGQMMAGTEGIPVGAIDAALDWKWTTFGEWLNRFDGNLGLNAGFQVGHSTLRRFVMGEDAVSKVANDEQLAKMKAVLHESLAAGGLGFSSSVNDHKDTHGVPVPSRVASFEEMVGLAAVCKEHKGTTLEMSPEAGGRYTDGFLDLMAAMSAAADRPLNWNVLRLYGPDVDSAYQRLSSADIAKARGGRVVGLTNPEITRHRLSFLTPFILAELPGVWNKILHLPEPQRIAALSDGPTRAQMKADAATEKTIGNRRGLISWGDHTIIECFTPETKRLAEGRTIAEVAAARGGIDPFDALLDVVVADSLRTRFLLKARGDDEETWRLRMELVRDPRTLIGGSDGGAHLDFQVGAQLTSDFLEQAVRDKKVISLEEAIFHITKAPADYYGLVGRGELKVGNHADVLIFDPETIGSKEMETRKDLPGGCGRMYAEANGVQAVYVNGTEIVHEGVFTGSLPGKTLRSGVDTGLVTA